MSNKDAEPKTVVFRTHLARLDAQAFSKNPSKRKKVENGSVEDAFFRLADQIGGQVAAEWLVRQRDDHALESPRTPPQLKKGLQKRLDQLEGGASSPAKSRGQTRQSSSRATRKKAA